MADIIGPGTHITLGAGQQKYTDVGQLIHSTDTYAVVIDGADVDFEVTALSTVSSAGTGTIRSTAASNDLDLTVAGNVRQPGSVGSAILLNGSNNEVQIGDFGFGNAIQGEVYSGNIAIWLTGSNSASKSTIYNIGIIYGENTGIQRDGAEGVILYNYGYLFGESGQAGAGAYVDYYGGADRIENAGFIGGDIRFGGGADVFVATVFNGGTSLVGGAVFAGDGDDLYDGRLGQISGGVVGEAGNDRIYTGVDDNKLYGGDGNDTLMGGAGADYLSGGTGTDRASYASATAGVIVSLANPSINTGDAKGDTFNSVENLSGSNYNDSVFGNSARNAINGGAGNDTIKGYGGNDTLTGYSGKDSFVFNSALNAATNVDTITDFSAVADTVTLDNAVFTVLAAGPLAASAFKDVAAGAKDASDRILYNSDTGNLYYDRDGSGGAYAAIKFAVLTGSPTLTAADFVVI